MEVIKDSLFLIGDSHKVCQDYTITGNTGDGVDYLIVCDGCSSSKDSDLGARILALMAKRNFRHLTGLERQDRKYFNFGNAVINAARQTALELQIDFSSLDATLIVAMKENDNVTVYVYGDGNIIVADKNGKLDITNISFESGAPFYLNYWNSQYRLVAYKSEFPGQVIVKGNNYLAREAFDCPVIYSFDCSTISMIAISTDGIESFESKPGANAILDQNIVQSGLFTFKNTNGEYLKRRVERHVLDLHKANIIHHDDLGIASMVFKESIE